MTVKLCLDWSSAAWPPTFLFLSFSTLYSSSLWTTDTIGFSIIIVEAPQLDGLEINKPPERLNRGFTVTDRKQILKVSNWWLLLKGDNTGRFDHAILISEMSSFMTIVNFFQYSLQASSPGHSGSETGKGRRAYCYVSGIWIPPLTHLWLPVDWAVRFPPISVKRKQVRT